MQSNSRASQRAAGRSGWARSRTNTQKLHGQNLSPEEMRSGYLIDVDAYSDPGVERRRAYLQELPSDHTEGVEGNGADPTFHSRSTAAHAADVPHAPDAQTDLSISAHRAENNVAANGVAENNVAENNIAKTGPEGASPPHGANNHPVQDNAVQDNTVEAMLATTRQLFDEDGNAMHTPVEDGLIGLERNSEFDPHVVWQTVLGELALQLPSSTYDTWVRDTTVIGYEDGEFIIGLPNAYARDWLENRLRHTIKRTLSSIMRRSIQIQFRVRARPPQDLHSVDTAPLYQTVSNDAGQSAKESVVGNSGDPTQRDKETATGFAQAEEHDPAERTPVAEHRDTVSANHISVESTGDAPAARAYGPGQLNPYHTFDTFVVGNHNRLAHAAAMAIVDTPGQTFNPLFIYGGVGLGKTHLLNAIGNSIRQKGWNMIYCSSEQFTNEMISAIRNQSGEQFRNKYRQVDVLLIDDIQFIGGKESTQEEFFHTFNHLHAHGRQVVISSDRPPKALATLEERLRSRFEGGLQTDIAQPDFETRVAILQSKANRMGVPVPYDVVMLVAERVDSNIRELEGALNRLVMQARLTNQTVELGLAKSLLENLAPQRLPCPPASVVRLVAEHFHLRAEDLTGRKRTKDIAMARQLAMYLLREENDLSLPAIGEQLGGRDHSTVRYGVERVTEDLDRDESLRTVIFALREKIYAPPGS